MQVSKTEVLNQLIPDAGTGLCLVLMFGAICWGLFRLRAIWRDDTDDDATRRELLAQFRDSQREGVLTDEEYRLIKGRLVRPITPTTETERRESAAKSTDSVKGFTASSTRPPDDEEPRTKFDEPR